MAALQVDSAVNLLLLLSAEVGFITLAPLFKLFLGSEIHISIGYVEAGNCHILAKDFDLMKSKE